MMDVKTLFLCVLLISLHLICCKKQERSRKKSSYLKRQQSKSLAQNTKDFAVSLSKEIFVNEEGNVLISPFSAQVILGLTLVGANGLTKTELANGLSLPQNKTLVKTGMKDLEAKLDPPTINNSLAYELNVANNIYISVLHNLKSTFLQDAKNYFNASAENIDFSNNVQAADTINKWVEDQTNEKIKNLIKPESLSHLTVAVLVNAIYFFGKWKIPFPEDRTKKEDFFVDECRTVKVDMMNNNERYEYHYSDSLQASFLRLRYVGDEMWMIVVLPDEGRDLSALENNLQAVFADKYYNKREVDVKLPKFSLTSTLQLKNILMNLGINEAFESNANFSSMVDDDVSISEVIQKTFINVTEKSTEATAATGVIISVVSVPSPPIIFHANRPFLFYIEDNDGIILFVGRCLEPSTD